MSGEKERIQNIEHDPFEGYEHADNPSKQERLYAWQTAIGLQAVDGLRTSDYLKDVAIRNIEGEISSKKAQELIESYYRTDRKQDNSRTEEADIVSSRISNLLQEKGFTFSSAQYLSIHRRLFENIYPHAGKIRKYNITKSEWVLDNDTVTYGSWSELMATLEYDISQEKSFSYEGLGTDSVIHHLAEFVSRLWQIHVFEEGNTRTTAAFFILYLQSKGFNVTNDIFKENAWYFRNALVRANYTNLKKGIHETTEYLELFLRNLLLEENNILSNRTMHVSGAFKKQNIDSEKQDIGSKKQDIDVKKQDIDNKQHVQYTFQDSLGLMIEAGLSKKSASNAMILFEEFRYDTSFSRADVVKALNITPSPASALLNKLHLAGIIKTIIGEGKGKYIFNPLFFE